MLFSMFWFIMSRFYFRINHYYVVIRYPLHGVTGFAKNWIGGKIWIKYVLFPTKVKLHLLYAMFLHYIMKALMLYLFTDFLKFMCGKCLPKTVILFLLLCIEHARSF